MFAFRDLRSTESGYSLPDMRWRARTLLTLEATKTGSLTDGKEKILMNFVRETEMLTPLTMAKASLVELMVKVL